LKLLHGETRPSRIGSGDPTAIEGTPETPPHLTDAELELWNALIAQLEPMHLLTQADGWALECLVSAILAFRASAHVVRISPMVRGKDGHFVRNPAWSLHVQAMREIRNFCHEFGLSPSARAGLSVLRHIEDSQLSEQLLS
jgi:P27 family predicted phage terminase small subunit